MSQGSEESSQRPEMPVTADSQPLGEQSSAIQAKPCDELKKKTRGDHRHCDHHGHRQQGHHGHHNHMQCPLMNGPKSDWDSWDRAEDVVLNVWN